MSKFILWAVLSALACSPFSTIAQADDLSIADTAVVVGYESEPLDIKFFRKDENGNLLKNFSTLKKWLESRGDSLVFAMNGGKFSDNLEPLGLYIEDGDVLAPLNTKEHAYGNFYLQPNGIFYITKDGRAVVCKTEEFGKDGNVQFATQSGPLLLINGQMFSKFTPESLNLRIRNGVGILPNGNVLFAISNKKVNFYQLASFFKNKGCEDALYLDGDISRAYIPELDWVQPEGTFAIIMAEVR